MAASSPLPSLGAAEAPITITINQPEKAGDSSGSEKYTELPPLSAAYSPASPSSPASPNSAASPSSTLASPLSARKYNMNKRRMMSSTHPMSATVESPSGGSRQNGRLAGVLFNDDTQLMQYQGPVNNPFAIPSHEDVFLMRERENRSKREERERTKNMKVWEKAMQSVKAQSLSQTIGAIRSRPMVSAVKPPLSTAPRREKENLSELIAKKRDVFLIQMSLDTKREEIKKLEEKAQLKEAALRKSEMMLEEDALRFDAFLKENDKKAHDALKRADKETKLKQEKVVEIKKLNQEISKVESEISKFEERLSFCLKYKNFLDDLTPAEHKEKIKALKEERARREKSAQGPGRSAGSSRATTASTTASHTNSEEEKKFTRSPSTLHADAGGDSSGVNVTGLSSGPEDVIDEMYFKEPAQLLDIFAQLEERNLFLIQNVQETEEALEELKQKYKETEVQMEEKTSQLKSNIDELCRKIRIEQEKAKNLVNRTSSNVSAGDQHTLLDHLANKVTEVYVQCGFDTTDTDTLDMLREIEGKLEELLLKISQMEPELLAKGEKEKETERRNRVRIAKYKEQQRQYDERLAKSNARAKAEVRKKVGKQVMFRSPPIRKKQKKQETHTQQDEEAEELRKFFT